MSSLSFVAGLTALVAASAVPTVRYAAEPALSPYCEGVEFNALFDKDTVIPTQQRTSSKMARSSPNTLAGVSVRSLKHKGTSRTSKVSTQALDKSQANIATFCIPNGADVAAKVAAIQQLPGVQQIAQNKAIHLIDGEAGDDAVVNAAHAWNLDRINQASAHLDGHYSTASDGEGVVVYVCDTGVVPHPDYADRMLPGWSAFEGTSPTTDLHGHGTHCSGTIGGTHMGVAPKATIIPLKVFNGTTATTTSTGIYDSINYAVKDHLERGSPPAVLSMSLGGKRDEEELGDAAVQAAIDAGIIVSVAAGNDARDSCEFWPAGSHNVLTVGATGWWNNTDYVADFSNYGRCVDLYAPGKDINSTGINFADEFPTQTMSGTSMACPAVSGAVATMLSRDPTLTQAQAIAGLKMLAVDVELNGAGEPVGTIHKFLQVVSGEEASCTDGLLNGDETMVDCGGSCAACPEQCGAHCWDHWLGDGVCDKLCNVEGCSNDKGDCDTTCQDGLRNGDEILIDCGGSCGPCPTPCNENCTKDWRGDGVCEEGCNNPECGFDSVNGTTIQEGDCAPFCDDGILNGDETERDCGGSCPSCGSWCPWLENTDADFIVGCADGATCNATEAGWGCCVPHGGRAMCPPNYKYMCAQDNRCGGGKDFCCAPSLEGCAGASGGPRLCREDVNPTPDPTCATGILDWNKKTCCPEQCGECGGEGCESRHGGFSTCCSQPIRASTIDCATSGPPCRM